jgi:hypothetical protein
MDFGWLAADLFNRSLGKANRPIGWRVDKTVVAYGGTCGSMTSWFAELLTAIDSSSSDLSFGTITDVMGALWRHVQKLVVAYGGRLEGRWRWIFHKSIDLCLASMNLV